jgi:hypothetical protein
LQEITSFWGHVNIVGRNEEWPTWNGCSLSPIIQINCDEIPLEDHPLRRFAFLTAFAIPDDIPNELGNEIVIRKYAKVDNLLVLEKPFGEILEPPTHLRFSSPIKSYPNKNDLPPGFRAFLV